MLKDNVQTWGNAGGTFRATHSAWPYLYIAGDAGAFPGSYADLVESSAFQCQGCLQRFLADILGKDAVVCYPDFRDGAVQPGHTMYPKTPKQGTFPIQPETGVSSSKANVV